MDSNIIKELICKGVYTDRYYYLQIDEKGVVTLENEKDKEIGVKMRMNDRVDCQLFFDNSINFENNVQFFIEKKIPNTVFYQSIRVTAVAIRKEETTNKEWIDLKKQFC